ncbi:hypothetical protein AFLA_005562 [Aspergillus flavus NRRL3357]|nr:hypothetical protein AFLA_005562 [Aspergillus flavus NRRL3357]
MYDAHFVWSVGSAWQRGTMALTDRCWSLPVCLPPTCHTPSFGQFQIDGLADTRTRTSMSSLVACILSLPTKNTEHSATIDDPKLSFSIELPIQPAIASKFSPTDISPHQQNEGSIPMQNRKQHILRLYSSCNTPSVTPPPRYRFWKSPSRLESARAAPTMALSGVTVVDRPIVVTTVWSG